MIKGYFDCHADTLTEINNEHESLWNASTDLDLKRIDAQTKRYGQIFAIWKDMETVPSDHVDEVFMYTYKNAMSLINAQQEKLTLCLNSKDMRQCFLEGKAAALLSIEDMSFMGKYVHQMHELGFRFVIPSWNYENQYACGAVTDQGKGLKPLGKSILSHVIAQGVIPDVSHLSDAGIEDLLCLTDGPVIASHSNVRMLCGTPRNLQECHIREIIRRGGIIGINFFRPFVGDGEHVTIADLMRHMCHILELGGEHNIALGSDLDGCDGLFPDGISGCQSLEFLYNEMARERFGKTILDQIFFENVRNFLDMIL